MVTAYLIMISKHVDGVPTLWDVRIMSEPASSITHSAREIYSELMRVEGHDYMEAHERIHRLVKEHAFFSWVDKHLNSGHPEYWNIQRVICNKHDPKGVNLLPTPTREIRRCPHCGSQVLLKMVDKAVNCPKCKSSIDPIR